MKYLTTIFLILLCLMAHSQNGCTYVSATNYDWTATIDDGTCVFDCPDVTSNDQAVYDAGVASVDITSNDQAVYDEAYADGVASVECPCPEDLAGGPSGDGDGVVNTADLLAFLTAFGTYCQ